MNYGSCRENRRAGAVARGGVVRVFLAALLAVAAAPAGAHGAAALERSPCRDLSFAGVAHTVCEIDLRRYRIDLHWRDADGRPYGSLGALERALAGQGRRIVVSMNAGMYEEDLSPAGLFVKAGQTQHPVNTRKGGGNFYMKPNGIFFIHRGGAGVAETQAFLHRRIRAEIATQSGPLLVTAGRLHPRFKADGDSRKIRNGVGVRRDGVVVLAISRQGISFGRFAELFRDVLRCPDALYLDGSVSRLSVDGAAGTSLSPEIGGFLSRKIGPIISVEERNSASAKF
ncbi:MAG: phosphodiester glycosidase family protein [Pseudochelatococcus sp.]|uniref:phosphodiester glycosidase family protein n=1 Tax=Pseudochelatococcus sp. TaxID=2020869 RepID=UPI003D91805C